MSLKPWKWQRRAPAGYPRAFCSGCPEAEQEQAATIVAYRARDRTAIHSHEQALAVKRRFEIRLAFSAAIAGMAKAAADPALFEDWLRAMSEPGRPMWYEDGDYRGWGAYSAWGSRARLGSSWKEEGWGNWGNDRTLPPRVAKTPHKKKRRKIRARERRELSARTEIWLRGNMQCDSLGT